MNLPEFHLKTSNPQTFDTPTYLSSIFPVTMYVKLVSKLTPCCHHPPTTLKYNVSFLFFLLVLGLSNLHLKFDFWLNNWTAGELYIIFQVHVFLWRWYQDFLITNLLTSSGHNPQPDAIAMCHYHQVRSLINACWTSRAIISKPLIDHFERSQNYDLKSQIDSLRSYSRLHRPIFLRNSACHIVGNASKILFANFLLTET